MRVGVIDVGTNSVRVLLTDGTGLGERDMTITRLGQGVDAARRLAHEAMERSVDAVDRYAARCRDQGIEHVRIVATSAVRDAANREVFLRAVRERTGIDAEVLSGEAEARYSFAGSTAGLDAPAPFVVIDIGGGSTEVIAGTDVITSAVSLDIGSVRLTERHVRSDPPTPQELEAIEADARAAITPAFAGISARTLIGVAGTVTTASAIVLGLQAYDPSRVHRSVLTPEDVRDVRARLAGMTNAERAALPCMPPGREDVIVAGLMILEQIVDASGKMDLIVSESDILSGVAAQMLAGVAGTGDAR